MRGFQFFFSLILGSMSLTGCGTVHYLLQAGKGQFALFNQARPIAEVIRDERTPPRIKELLSEIGEIKKFGERNGLKPTSNYTEYVKLDRDAAVWVVSASEPLQFKAKQWSFPIVGSFTYLGWFAREDAINYARDLKKEGLDVDVRGARAYSTLGWFRDSVLSTMIPKGDEALGDLVNVVIHESVHSTFYIEGQSSFNESLASFVADHLTLVYLDEKRGAQSPEKKAYLDAEEWGRKVEEKFHQSYKLLADLYSSSQSETEKTEKKKEILAALKQDLKYPRDINNATLIQYKTYNTSREAFDKLRLKCQSDWNCFLKKILKLNKKSFSESQQEDLMSVIDKIN